MEVQIVYCATGHGRVQGYGLRDQEDPGAFGADARARRGGALQHGAGEVGRQESARGRAAIILINVLSCGRSTSSNTYNI